MCFVARMRKNLGSLDGGRCSLWYWFWWSGTFLLESSNAKWRGTDMQYLQTSVLKKQGFSKSVPFLTATEEAGGGL